MNPDKPNARIASESNPAWRLLHAEIETKLPLKKSEIELGGQTLDWYRVADPDLLLEEAAASDPEGTQAAVDPFWSVAWRAALGLDRFLARLNLCGTRVLELGCGSGQAGTAAALRGGTVTLTDSVPIALKVAQLNAWSVADRVRFQQLFWGDLLSDSEPFPVIIGSDLVYDPGRFEKLEQSMRRNLSPLGRVYLSEPHRHSGDAFSTWIREAGWLAEEHDVDMQDNRIPIRVFECSLA